MEPPFRYQWWTRKKERYKLAGKERKKEIGKKEREKEREREREREMKRF